VLIGNYVLKYNHWSDIFSFGKLKFEFVSDLEMTETLSIDFRVILKSYLDAGDLGLC
jgi:hypothetical protein